MHVLLLAYYFPPDGGPGCQRPLSFARHLPGTGVSCTVLTRAIAAKRGAFDPEDAAPLEGVLRHAKVERAAPASDWPELHHQLVIAGSRAIAAQRPDVIVTTMSPFELWRVADELGQRHAVPTVHDLRDPWALDGVQEYRSRWHWWRQWREMRRMLHSADGIVANTAESRKAILAAAPKLDPNRVTHITNGWDRTEFGGLHGMVPTGETLDLVHGGSFLCSELYAHERPLRKHIGWLRYRPEPIQTSGRTPVHLLGAIRRLREANEPAGHETRFRVIGQVDEHLQRCVHESGVADAVELCGYRPHHELLSELQRAPALFLTLHGLPSGRRARIVPGKTYEYLAAGRPILAALPEGDAKDLVATSPHSFVSDPCDEQALAAQLVELHRRWRVGELQQAVHPPDLERYERRNLANQLASFLERVLDRGPTSLDPDRIG